MCIVNPCVKMMLLIDKQNRFPFSLTPYDDSVMMRKLATLCLLVCSFAEAGAQSIDDKINQVFAEYTGWFAKFIFYKIPFSEQIQVPWVVLLLVIGAVYFTIYFRFINFSGFRYAINVIRGKYDHLEDKHKVEVSESVFTVDGDNPDTIRIEGHSGEVSHFQALTAALSGTLGLGNIAGVAVALSIGGPGATFWMIICGLLGMASKFVECTLGVTYRDIDKDGIVYGGPMYYLTKGLAERGLIRSGKILSVSLLSCASEARSVEAICFRPIRHLRLCNMLPAGETVLLRVMDGSSVSYWPCSLVW
ncbi:sodium/alanine symporter AgcS [Filimonas sp.]|nr:sodium/alanine symporter AgcS [Filimonas sp.]